MGGEELNFVKAAFDSNYVAPLGPMVDAFEQEFAEKVGIPYAAAVSSGTAAMHLALRILGVGQGDEVIASTLTFIGGVTPILFQDTTPVFIDCDWSSWNMNPDLLADELNYRNKKGKLPKAVVPTDLYGQCADLDRILEICNPYGIPVVVDSAEALGAYYRSATDPPQYDHSDLRGRHGHIQKNGIKSKIPARHRSRSGEAGRRNPKSEMYKHAEVGAKAAVFSFNGNKIITTSGGGMLVSDDKALIDQVRFLSQQARDRAPHYEHSTFGYNYRMSNIVAAIGRGQLRVLDDRVEAKRRIFTYYQEKLGNIPGIEFMPEPGWSRSNRWLTVILVKPEEFGADRETVRIALESKNIEARPVWKPMHMQPVFDVLGRKAQGIRRKEGNGNARYKARVVGGEVAEDLFNRGLCLPSGTAIKEEDLDRVISVILSCKK